MYFDLSDRQDRSCPSGKLWYTCAASSYAGCCSVDACHYTSGCPDEETSSSSSSSDRSTSTSTSTSISPTLTPTSSSSSLSSTSIDSTTQASSTSTSPPIFSPTTTGQANSTASELPVSKVSESSRLAPIIAGIVCGAAVIGVLAVLVWYFGRRRRNKLRQATPLIGPGSNGHRDPKDYNGIEDMQIPSGGVFAPFGGYHQPPSTEAKEYHELETQERPPLPAELGDVADEQVPISDPEKSALVPPPVHEHPALSPPLPSSTLFSQNRRSAPAKFQPAYNSLPSQLPQRSNSWGPTVISSSPEHQPQSRNARAGSQPNGLLPTKLSVLEEFPELASQTISSASLNAGAHKNLSELPGPTSIITTPPSHVVEAPAEVPINKKELEVAPKRVIPELNSSPPLPQRDSRRLAILNTHTPPIKPTKDNDLLFDISLLSPQSPPPLFSNQSQSPQKDHTPKRSLTNKNASPLLPQDFLSAREYARDWDESNKEHVMSWATYKASPRSPTESDKKFKAATVESSATEGVKPLQLPGKTFSKNISPVYSLRSELEGREIGTESSPSKLNKTSQQDGASTPLKSMPRSISGMTIGEKKNSISSIMSRKRGSNSGSLSSYKVSPQTPAEAQFGFPAAQDRSEKTFYLA